MKKFRVYITRTYVHGATIEVEAKDAKQAERLALQELDDTALDIEDAVKGQDTAEVIEEVI